MNYCKIQNGYVVDRAVFEEPMPLDWPDSAMWVQNDEAQIGWSYSNGVFSPPPAPETPEPAPLEYVLQISVFWTRMTDEEAEDFDGAMATASPLRLRRAFNSATSMTSETELFLFVRAVLVGVVSTTRADAIMAPSLDGTSSLIEAS